MFVETEKLEDESFKNEMNQQKATGRTHTCTHTHTHALEIGTQNPEIEHSER